MKPKIPTLLQAAETMTSSERNRAPELATLVTLDASLLATIENMRSNQPFRVIPGAGWNEMAMEPEFHLAQSIVILAMALRNNLGAYYAAIQNSTEDYDPDQDVEF